MAWSLFLCVVPFFFALTAGITALLFGCEVDLATSHPCVIAGRDIRSALELIMTPAIFLYLTLPLAVLLAILWLMIEVIRWLLSLWSGG